MVESCGWFPDHLFYGILRLRFARARPRDLPAPAFNVPPKDHTTNSADGHYLIIWMRPIFEVSPQLIGQRARTITSNPIRAVGSLIYILYLPFLSSLYSIHYILFWLIWFLEFMQLSLFLI